MRVPRQLLREEIAVRDYAGSGARGPSFIGPRTVRASVQATSRFIVAADGTQVGLEALAIIRPEDGPVTVESRVTHGATEYRVVRCYAMPDARRASHYELALARLSVAS